MASTTTAVVSVHHVDAKSAGVEEESVVVDGKKQQQGGGGGGGEAGENFVKSSLKKEAFDSKEVEEKKVQWMDFLGKELVEIREFEARWVLFFLFAFFPFIYCFKFLVFDVALRGALGVLQKLDSRSS